MAVIRPTNETDYALKIGGLAQDKLSVVSFSIKSVKCCK